VLKPRAGGLAATRAPVSEIRMTTIYVGNLPFTATEDEVRSLFER
jgi:RNA recognition motif-containing protein